MALKLQPAIELDAAGVTSAVLSRTVIFIAELSDHPRYLRTYDLN